MIPEHEYLMWYFRNVLGYCPDEALWLPTRSSIAYMLDNCLFGQEITQELRRHNSPVIHPDALTDQLWKDSLLQKGHFYFHKELQIVSPAPVLKKDGTVSVQDDFLVMRIQYTAQDILDYFYTRISQQEKTFCEPKTDLKTVSYILGRFENVDQVEPVDLLLCLIDDYTNNMENRNTKGLISVLNSLQNILPWYQSDVKNAAAAGKNKIRWHYGV